MTSIRSRSFSDAGTYYALRVLPSLRPHYEITKDQLTRIYMLLTEEISVRSLNAFPLLESETPPSLSTLEAFVQRICIQLRLTIPILVTAISYLERLAILAPAGSKLNATSCFKLALTSLLLANKFIEDGKVDLNLWSVSTSGYF